MTFGRHRGEDLAAIPDSYLRWVLGNVSDLSPHLRRAIEARLGIARETAAGPGGPVPPLDLQRVAHAVRDGIRDAYRAESLRFHPDHRGGSTDAQIALNCLYERLNEVVSARIRELAR